MLEYWETGINTSTLLNGKRSDMNTRTYTVSIDGIEDPGICWQDLEGSLSIFEERQNAGEVIRWGSLGEGLKGKPPTAEVKL
ncbi:hypothetical protein E2C01_097613 [Portunus trituberculatus]|uniref:Uncharacterized protein n=1 Tax=Portunus trituberculatus TaxID=210409 RepID=A0A5B7KA36_PORTR|nr:hypothetical protein [Portunus trituberculatus]